MSKIRVVLIEDHDLTRMGIRAAVQQRQDIEVVGEAANATEGINLVERVRPDIAIVDIDLPDKNGIEVTRQIKSSQKAGEGPQTKVLILTMRDNKESVLAAFAAGADSYCLKDISFDNLLEAILLTHNGNTWIDPALVRIVLQQAQQSSSATAAYPLTERELEVLQLIVEGWSNAAIAEKLYITVGTVKLHVRNILNKFSRDGNADGPPPIPLPRRPGPKPGTFDAAELPPIDGETP